MPGERRLAVHTIKVAVVELDAVPLLLSRIGIEPATTPPARGRKRARAQALARALLGSFGRSTRLHARVVVGGARVCLHAQRDTPAPARESTREKEG